MWNQACSSQEEEFLNINSQTASVANSRVCCWDWLCRAGLCHPSTAPATRTSILPFLTCQPKSLKPSHISAGTMPQLWLHPQWERERTVPSNALTLGFYCFALANVVGPSLRKLPILSGYSWADVWGDGHIDHLVTRATAGTCTSDVWEQLHIENLPSAEAVTASSQMLGKSLPRAQNDTRQPCPFD